MGRRGEQPRPLSLLPPRPGSPKGSGVPPEAHLEESRVGKYLVLAVRRHQRAIAGAPLRAVGEEERESHTLNGQRHQGLQVCRGVGRGLETQEASRAPTRERVRRLPAPL